MSINAKIIKEHKFVINVRKDRRKLKIRRSILYCKDTIRFRVVLIIRKANRTMSKYLIDSISFLKSLNNRAEMNSEIIVQMIAIRIF